MSQDPSQDPRRFVAAILVAFVALVGCDNDDLGSGPYPGPASFDRIQGDVFNAQCVACHGSGSHYATESGLVLEPSVAYQNLIGTEPRNATARAAGLTRVEPGDPEQSLLFHKLRWEPPEGIPDFGNPMPLGGSPLTAGEVEFFRQWILAGAPRSGSVADPDLLLDDTGQELREFVAPEVPADGFQMHLSEFDVWPHAEREVFVHQPVGNSEDLWVNAFEIEMRRNSHHFILYAIDPDAPAEDLPGFDEIRDLWLPNGNPSGDRTFLGGPQRFFGGSMTRSYYSEFPEGVALRLPASSTMDLNSHYVNYTGSVIPGEVYANVHTIDPREVAHEAFPLFLNNSNLYIAEEAETTIERTFQPAPAPLRIFMLTSHMHQRGTGFVIEVVRESGAVEEIYRTASWDNPDVIYPDPPLELDAGDRLRSIVTFFNPTPDPIQYGLTAADEMAIIIGYFYRPEAVGPLGEAERAGVIEGLGAQSHGGHSH